MTGRWWDDDERLLAELGDALRSADEVPRRFVDAGKAAYTWRSVDAELAALTFDSATSELATTTRAEPATLRALTFAAADLTIEVEVTSDALLGQVVPPQAGEVTLELRDGTTYTAPIDEVGWFALRPLPAATFRLQVATEAGEVRTDWVTL